MYTNIGKVMAALLLGTAALAPGGGAAAAKKEDRAGHKPVLLRVPNHGIQPQVAVGPGGVVHLLYGSD